MNVRAILFPPGATRQDWIFDTALAASLALVAASPYFLFIDESTIGTSTIAVIALLMVLPIVLRRHSPLIMLAGCSLAGLLEVIYSPYPMATLIVIPIVAYTVARWIAGPVARVVVVVGLIGSILGPARWMMSSIASGFSVRMLINFLLAVFLCSGLVVTPYAMGRRVRDSFDAARQRITAAEERYRLLLAEREQQTRLAEANIRTTIARELHDIVAHSLSVMIVQAEGARALADKRPEAAAEALDTIAEIGREALNEMRHMLSVLRRGPQPGEEADFAPAPTLADIPELVERTSSRVEFATSGTPPRLSPAVELVAYRVVQEALTNFLKHAGTGATATVALVYGPSAMNIEVKDNGAGAEDVESGPGHGLRGMRERVSSMGGTLTLQHAPGSGFIVRARLPFRPTESNHNAHGLLASAPHANDGEKAQG